MTVFTASGFIGRLWRRAASAGLGLALAAAGATAAHAQLRVDISGVGATQYPIAIADFAGAASATSAPEVIRADLTRSGQFRLIGASGAGLDVQSKIDYGTWQARRRLPGLWHGRAERRPVHDQLPAGRQRPQDRTGPGVLQRHRGGNAPDLPPDR